MKKLGKEHEARGFQHIQDIIAKKEGLSKKSAGAILAARTREASASAKRKNPNLKKVRMPKKGK